jgi:glyoxylase-like metal-dependent hydrolase (beta-lactamase superfamily II)
MTGVNQPGKGPGVRLIMSKFAEAVTVHEMAEDIYCVRLPLPFALNHVNCYLLRDDDGWTIVDAGLNRPELRDLWQAAWRELAIEPHTIRRIVLTHMHPDHFGLAGWLQIQTGAPVFLSPRERAVATVTWLEDMTAERKAAVDGYLHAAGATPEVAVTIQTQQDYLRSLTYPHPYDIAAIQPGEQVLMGGRRFEAIHAPGHADGQLIFYSAADRLFLCGDQVLMRITPNIGIWPTSEANPLGRYLASLTALMVYDVRLALPGHYAPIEHWRTRLTELRVHHDQRLVAMAETVQRAGAAGATAVEVSYQVFDYDRFSTHEVRFAVAETLAHLEFLVDEGRLERLEGEWRRYRLH